MPNNPLTSLCAAKGYRQNETCSPMPKGYWKARIICNGCGHMLGSNFRDDAALWADHLERSANA